MSPARTSSTSLPRAGAVSKGYNFASSWEQNAPLTEQQQAAIVALSHAVAERPFPSSLAQESIMEQERDLSTSTKDATSEESLAVEAVLVNTNQFYKWFTDLESAMKSETEKKYRHYVDTLTQRINICDGILKQVDDTLDLFNDLKLQHQAVATKTKTLHDACDRLVLEKQRLLEFADALHSKLSYFELLENIATSFHSPSMKVEHENFFTLLKRLDECITYVQSNPQYAESSVYLVKFRQLQSRALSMIRSHVHSVLKSAFSQVQRHLLYMFTLRQLQVSLNLSWKKLKADHQGKNILSYLLNVTSCSASSASPWSEEWSNNGYQILLGKKHCHPWLEQAAHISCRVMPIKMFQGHGTHHWRKQSLFSQSCIAV